MTIGLLLFSRYDSQRLPAKAIHELAGRSLLKWCIERCKKVQGDVQVIVATSERDVDLPIIQIAEQCGVQAFCGDAYDVLGRTYTCAQHYNFDAIVRISADSPFIDPRLIEDMLSQYANHPDKVVTNLHPRRFPPGQSVEILPFEVLRSLHENCKDPALREHVTPLLYQEDSPYGYVHFDNPNGDQSQYDLTVDTAQDWQFLSQLAAQIDLDSSLQNILSAYDRLKEED